MRKNLCCELQSRPITRLLVPPAAGAPRGEETSVYWLLADCLLYVYCVTQLTGTAFVRVGIVGWWEPARDAGRRRTSCCSVFHSSIVKVTLEVSLAHFSANLRQIKNASDCFPCEGHVASGFMYFSREKPLRGLLARSLLPVCFGDNGIMPQVL